MYIVRNSGLPLQPLCEDHGDFINYFKNIWNASILFFDLSWGIQFKLVKKNQKLIYWITFLGSLRGGCYGFLSWSLSSHLSSAYWLPTTVLCNFPTSWSKTTFVSFRLTQSLNMESQGITCNSKFPGNILFGQTWVKC